MSLATNVTNLATRTGSELKAHRILINGNVTDLSALSTTAKANLVAAINEINAAVATASGIDDAQVSTSTGWSSSKVSSEIATARAGAVDDAVDDGAPSTSTAWSSSNTRAEIDAATAALIDDDAPSATSVYSSAVTDSLIQTAKDDILGGAGAAFDTLGELQAALAADDTAITGINNALGLRVRVDAAQAFTAPQQTQARSNIAAAATGDVTALSAAIGDVNTSYVAALEAALV